MVAVVVDRRRQIVGIGRYDVSFPPDNAGYSWLATRRQIARGLRAENPCSDLQLASDGGDDLGRLE
jgi:hypothetical protein